MKEILPIYFAKFKFSLELMIINWLHLLFKHNDYWRRELLLLRDLLDTLTAILSPDEPDCRPEPVHFDPLPLNYITLDNQEIDPALRDKSLRVAYQPQLPLTGKVSNALGAAFSFRLENQRHKELERGTLRLQPSPVNTLEKRLELSFSRLPGPGMYNLYLFPQPEERQSRERDQYGYYPEAVKYILIVK